ncbi:hypothetical protein EHS39_27780 [Ensifer sp. MPMI2T]|nr:hypothetical protein EHS39_27780 [Ensifer sp. MPMI2T]
MREFEHRKQRESSAKGDEAPERFRNTVKQHPLRPRPWACALQRRASHPTHKRRCSTLNCCMFLSLNRLGFKQTYSSRTERRQPSARVPAVQPKRIYFRKRAIAPRSMAAQVSLSRPSRSRSNCRSRISSLRMR